MWDLRYQLWLEPGRDLSTIASYVSRARAVENTLNIDLDAEWEKDGLETVSAAIVRRDDIQLSTKNAYRHAVRMYGRFRNDIG